LKAIVLAGGYATRLRPLSCSKPKLLFPVVGVPLIDLMISWLKEGGVREVVLAVNHLAERLRIEVGEKRLGSRVMLSVEETPLGTAGPIRLARDLLEDEPFVVVNGDIVSDISLKGMLEAHQEHGASATMSLVTVPDPKPYGSVTVDPRGRVTSFQEKTKSPRGSHLVNAGAYILDPSIIDRIPSARQISLEQTIFPELARRGHLWGWKHEGYWYDIGRIQNYVQANRQLLERFHGSRPSSSDERDWNGFVRQPSYIGEGSTFQKGAQVGPGAIFSRGVVVGEGAAVRDSIIFENTTVGRECLLDSVLIGERVTIGAKTRIGRGAVVAGEVNVPPGSTIRQGAVILN
jgi:NDP-sugar pyrophosphorylase family protein